MALGPPRGDGGVLVGPGDETTDCCSFYIYVHYMHSILYTYLHT